LKVGVNAPRPSPAFTFCGGYRKTSPLSRHLEAARFLPPVVDEPSQKVLPLLSEPLWLEGSLKGLISREAVRDSPPRVDSLLVFLFLFFLLPPISGTFPTDYQDMSEVRP